MRLSEEGSDRYCAVDFLNGDRYGDDWRETPEYLAPGEPSLSNAHRVIVPVEVGRNIGVRVKWRGTYQRLHVDFLVDGILRDSWKAVQQGGPKCVEHTINFQDSWNLDGKGYDSIRAARMEVDERKFPRLSQMPRAHPGQIGAIEIVIYLTCAHCSKYTDSIHYAPDNNLLRKWNKVTRDCDTLPPLLRIVPKWKAPVSETEVTDELYDALKCMRPNHLWTTARFLYRTTDQVNNSDVLVRSSYEHAAVDSLFCEERRNSSIESDAHTRSSSRQSLGPQDDDYQEDQVPTGHRAYEAEAGDLIDLASECGEEINVTSVIEAECDNEQPVPEEASTGVEEDLIDLASVSGEESSGSSESDLEERNDQALPITNTTVASLLDAEIIVTSEDEDRGISTDLSNQLEQLFVFQSQSVEDCEEVKDQPSKPKSTNSITISHKETFCEQLDNLSKTLDGVSFQAIVSETKQKITINTHGRAMRSIPQPRKRPMYDRAEDLGVAVFAESSSFISPVIETNRYGLGDKVADSIRGLQTSRFAESQGSIQKDNDQTTRKTSTDEGDTSPESPKSPGLETSRYASFTEASTAETTSIESPNSSMMDTFVPFVVKKGYKRHWDREYSSPSPDQPPLNMPRLIFKLRKAETRQQKAENSLRVMRIAMEQAQAELDSLKKSISHTRYVVEKHRIH